MILSREQLEEREKEFLAPFATTAQKSLGRNFEEKKDPFRTCFQRDRDRIIHSKAFRRLKGKTQVFVAHHGDHFRSRLTHTMEVAQVSRDIARTLGLNEDLAETIALAHDLGHTPFGHAGQDALDEKMQSLGSKFEHNKQSVRIVTNLERRSENFDGLNLSKEVIEGMGKHDTPYDKPEAEPGALPSLEAQVVNLADEIAYLNHDLDDGLRAEILKVEDLEGIKLWEKCKELTPQMEDFSIWLSRCKSKLIHLLISDIYQETEKRLKESNIQTLDDVRNCNQKLVAYSSKFFKEKEELRIFLFQKFYKVGSVEAMNKEGQKIIQELFDFFMHNPNSIPDEYHKQSGDKPLHYIVCDYIAGMTDNFAETLYENFLK